MSNKFNNHDENNSRMNSAETGRLPSAKAITDDDRSDGIVVSFASRWHEPLLNKAFNYVIRKQVPKINSPKWLYFHLNSPIQAICAKARIQRICFISLRQAIDAAQSIALSPLEIKDYFWKSSQVGCYAIADIQLATQSITASKLNTLLRYNAPQSYVILSKLAKQIIDAAAGFTE